MIYDSECIQKNNDLRNDLGRFDYFSYIVTNRYVSVHTRDYKKVQATVESIDQEYGEYSSEGTSIVHVISFSYTVDGTEYENCYKQLTKIGYAEGKQITVYYDPEDPGEVRPTMRSEEIVLLGTFFILIMALILTKKAPIST